MASLPTIFVEPWIIIHLWGSSALLEDLGLHKASSVTNGCVTKSQSHSRFKNVDDQQKSGKIVQLWTLRSTWEVSSRISEDNPDLGQWCLKKRVLEVLLWGLRIWQNSGIQKQRKLDWWIFDDLLCSPIFSSFFHLKYQKLLFKVKNFNFCEGFNVTMKESHCVVN